MFLKSVFDVTESENTDQRYTPMLSDQDAITEDFLGMSMQEVIPKHTEQQGHCLQYLQGRVLP